jgi:hypothetical protein
MAQPIPCACSTSVSFLHYWHLWFFILYFLKMGYAEAAASRRRSSQEDSSLAVWRSTWFKMNLILRQMSQYVISVLLSTVSGDGS